MTFINEEEVKMAYLNVNGDPCISPGIEKHNAMVAQYIEEFRFLQSRLNGLSSSMEEAAPAIGNDKIIQDCIAECCCLLARCEQRCMEYDMYG